MTDWNDGGSGTQARWLKACGIFCLLTVGTATAIFVIGGRPAATALLFLWPLFPAPVVFAVYVFLKRRQFSYLRRHSAVIGLGASGIWTLLAVIAGAFMDIVRVIEGSGPSHVVPLGAMLLPAASWPSLPWSALAGYLSLRSVKA